MFTVIRKQNSLKLQKIIQLRFGHASIVEASKFDIFSEVEVIPVGVGFQNCMFFKSPNAFWGS